MTDCLPGQRKFVCVYRVPRPLLFEQHPSFFFAPALCIYFYFAPVLSSTKTRGRRSIFLAGKILPFHSRLSSPSRHRYFFRERQQRVCNIVPYADVGGVQAYGDTRNAAFFLGVVFKLWPESATLEQKCTLRATFVQNPVIRE